MAAVDIRNITRSIHLDFHTSPFIPDVAKDFDAGIFAKRLKRAHVERVNIFSKCHHGMFYYPTTIGTIHPALDGRDLLGEMITALHAEGIACPIYTTVCWEENLAHQHPEWRDLRKDGTFADLRNSADMVTKQPAPWKFLNFLHPEYISYFKEHLKELNERYDCDGFWIDIVFLEEEGGWSPEFVKRRQALDLMEDTPENKLILESEAQKEFAQEITTFIKSLNPEASIFYNTPNTRFIDHKTGIFQKSKYQTQFDIESLPSGFWGYHHFPRVARHIMSKGKPFLGMTGKFQKMWGDFGGIKPQAALEYECFKAQAMGGGVSVGDQMHPRGLLDEDTYNLIGNVFEQVEQAEDFYTDSECIADIAVLCPNHPSLDETETGKSEEGIVQLLEELHYDFVIIDDSDDLEKYRLILLPDSVVVDAALRLKLTQYHARGGQLILSYKSGFSRDNEWQLSFISSAINGEAELYPTYWRVQEAFFGNSIKNERVIYHAGLNLKPSPVAEVLIDRYLPYFKRTDHTYMSHFHAPVNQKDPHFVAAIKEGNAIYFADRIFHEYRQKGSQFIKEVLRITLERTIGKPQVGSNLPGSILVYPRRKSASLLVTLLRYIPVRKAVENDVIDEAHSFYGETLNIDKPVTIKDFTTGEILEMSENQTFYKLPNQKGRLLLEIENYY